MRMKKATPRLASSTESLGGSIGAPIADEDTSSRSRVLRYDELDNDFFDELYLALNPDVGEAIASGTIASAYEHWAGHGQHEEKNAQGLRSSLTYLPPARSVVDALSLADHPDVGFDALSYLYVNPDVLRASDGSAAAARSHWTMHGRSEGRIAPGIVRRPLRDVHFNKLAARPWGLNIFGPFGTASGLGTAARALAKAVRAAKIPFALHPFDLTAGELRVSAQDTVRPTYKVNLLMANADTVARLFAAYKPGWFDDAYNIAVWQWELASPRSDTFYHFDGLDEVWTNSQFQVRSIRSVAPVPVTLIHIPVVAPSDPAKAKRSAFGIPEGKFTFLLPFDVGSTSARKNPFMVVEVFKAIARFEMDAHLVIKYHSARHEDEFIGHLLDIVGGMPSISVISEALTLTELDDLRASCDCLVSAHRSEGFGLNIAEMMSLGKPVIATGYSGNTDFFDEETGFPIDYEVVEIAKQSGPYQPGFVWAEPSAKSLEEQMLRVLSDRDEVTRRGQAAAARIKTLLGVHVVGRAIAERLAALELDAHLPAFLSSMRRGDQAARVPLSTFVDSQPGRLAGISHPPLISIVTPVYNVDAAYLRACIQSVQKQTYPLWELCICDDCSSNPGTLAVLAEFEGVSPMIKIIRSPVNGGISIATNKALELAVGEFVAFLDNDDVLEPTALEEVARLIAAEPAVDVIYTDETKIDANGVQIDHFYKPDWSPEHLESVMYVLHLMVVRKRLLLTVGGLRGEYTGAQDFDLMLRCSRATNNIRHIPKALYQWRAIPGSAAATVDAKPTALENGRKALAEHARLKYGRDASVEAGLIAGTFRLRRPLSNQPAVSLLIPTGNAHLDLPGRLDTCLVENLVASIRDKTDYQNYRIVVIDNSTLSKDQKVGLEELGAVVLNYEKAGPFNYAAKMNYALRASETEYVVMMNDDMEVVRPDWLTSMLELASDPGIGAVGARLLHLDGTIQHVGVVLGVNDVAHVYHSYPGEMIGYNGFTHIVRNYSAVTAACMATRRSVIAQVGWLDEQFAIDFNDIDLCLRIRRAGYRIAYTPYAELKHFEGVSAKRTTQNPVEVELFRSRWQQTIDRDPFYNINLSRKTHDYALR